MKNKFENVFFNIKTYINYMLNDEHLIYSSNYINCIQEILNILTNTFSKIQKIYYKYVLYPKLSSYTTT